MSTLFPPRLLAAALLPLALLLVSIAPLGAQDAADPSAPPPHYVATIHPVAAILREVTRGRGEVSCLLPGGVSPHTYEPRPSDARLAESASAFFFVSEHLDGWAARLAAHRRVELLPLLPAQFQLSFDDDEAGLAAHTASADAPHDLAHGHGHDHGEIDPHFWSDPLAVKALLPPLVEALIASDPAGEPVYRANAADFAARLDALHAAAAELLAPIRGRSVILFHPSLRYLLRRYDLRLAGVIEPSPGWEASPKYLHALVKTIRDSGARTIFSEPQLPDRPARILAEAASVELALLDPNGGVAGRKTYEELILFNTRTLREALE